MAISNLVSIIKALITRILFAGHSLLVVWRVTDVTGNWHLWFLLMGNVLLLAEVLYTCIKRKGHEWKWFSPSVFLYLGSVVPGILILEIDRIDRHRADLDNNTDAADKSQEEIGLSNLQGVEVPIQLSPDLWVLSMEQVLLFVLIIGRWLMPKGEVSHDQLSQLLFVYIGIASDIMELFILFNESYVIQDEILTYTILSAWSFSLMQFTLVLTATKMAKTRAVGVAPLSDNSESDEKDDRSCKCCETEVWSILTAVCMQDAPFLAIRLYVMIKNRTLTYSILFFTFKNALILGMQFYRLIVVICNHYNSGRENMGSKENLKKQNSDTINIEICSDIEQSPKSTSGRSGRSTPSRKDAKSGESNGVAR